MTEKETHPNIAHLFEGEVFVFGSNMSGRHGKGAAKTAMKWGAKYGQAAGLQGRTYGIPTVNSSITQKLALPKIQGFVDEFTEFAKQNPSLTFLVTEIGCGLAGWTPKEIGPMFEKASFLDNVFLPKKFWRTLSK
jgi:hypothetical protein